METKIKRRYKQGDPEWKQYNDFFDRCLLNSNILNAGNQAIGLHTEFMDLPGIKVLLHKSKVMKMAGTRRIGAKHSSAASHWLNRNSVN